ncbi:single-stranded DNA-binding protein [Mesobacillus subterraneus]|uniref:single-stranded DNA-binding protein n=1 Tax=Mesobacillus subterraneus TaxID=285983 RepID=UPI00203E4108|nr:single-stranded DNA-binding protein [Mesobacillus subterraneus]MCM3683790.1 single-stranded DNA-binding protein [Mesobacillus subterraneus]
MINQVTLVGRLVKDPELKWTTDGKGVSNVTLAVNRHYKNANGEIEADFVHCTLWGKTAENTSQFCRKGSVIGVTGRIQTRHYENQEGKRVYVTEVVAEGVRFLSSKQNSTRESEQNIAPPLQREELPFA